MTADPPPAGRRLPFLLVIVLLVLTAPPQGLAQGRRAQAVSTCTVLLVRNLSPDGASRIARIELPAASTTGLPSPPQHLDALGYADAQALTYGVTRSGAAVTIDRDGRTTDRGAIRLGDPPVQWNGLGRATAGTVVGDRWYVLQDGILYTVDISSRRRTYLAVLRAIALAPVELSAIGDFAVDPRDGSLYGVSVSEQGDVTAVRIDIDSGTISPDRDVQLPGADAFGSMAIGPDGSRYLLADGARASTLYRLPAGESGGVTEIGTGPPSSTSDMAGCLGPPRPPGRPPPSAPSPPRPPPPAPSPTKPAPRTSAPRPVPLVPSPASSTPPSTTPSDKPSPPTTATAPVSVAPPMRPPPPWPGKQENNVQAANSDTAKKRRWALTVLLLVIGGAAVARAAGRSR